MGENPPTPRPELSPGSAWSAGPAAIGGSRPGIAWSASIGRGAGGEGSADPLRAGCPSKSGEAEDSPGSVAGTWLRAGRLVRSIRSPKDSASSRAGPIRTIVVLPHCGPCLVPLTFPVFAGQEPRERMPIVAEGEVLKV